MCKFLKISLVWLLILFVLSLCADRLITTGLHKVDSRKYAVWNDIYRGTIGADLLILGSSETWCAYDTRLIDSLLNCNSYNLAIDAHGFKYQKLRYDTYRKFNPAPKWVIINLDYPGSLDPNTGYGYEREQFFPFIRDKELIDAVASDKDISFFDRYLPLIRYYGYKQDIRDGISALFGKTHFKDGGFYKGYRANDFAWSPGSLNLDSVFCAPADKDLVALLNGFVQDLRSEGIKVVLIEFPEYHLLRNKFSNVDEIEGIFQGIAKENNIPILDYSGWDVCLDTRYYYNPSHLNKLGSDLFTRQLCHDLDSLRHL
jgi:hypothetical protein